MPSTKHSIPEDTRQVDSTPTTDDEWKSAEGAHQELQNLVQSKPAAKRRFEETLAEINERQMTLKMLRQAKQLTQSTIAELLEMDQSEVSRLESRSDMLLSTLRRFVEATGGEMHIVVNYPNGSPVELFIHNED